MQHSTLAYPTLYASALITFNKGGYTKHYFEGTNRVCSKIGGGFYHVHMDSIENRVPALAGGYDNQSDEQRESVEHTFNDCLGLEVETDGIVDLYDVIKHESKRHDPEPAFFYHSDHLGSAAYLTNDAGQVTQTLNYLPYGEDWVDIQNNLDPNLGMYTYNGKEKDYESGFHYYGARYYWSELLTGWLSVDPMMDKYPSLSPYNYCAWNPVVLTDPDGKEIDNYRLDINTGELRFYEKTDDERDCIEVGYYSDNEWISTEVSFDCAKGILVPDEKVDNSTIHLFANEYEGLSLMVNVSFACHKEIAAYSFIDGKTVFLEIFPWKENNALHSTFMKSEKVNKGNIIYDIHTHCGTINYKNDGSGTLSPSDTDKENGLARNNLWNHYILSIKHGLGQYDQKGNVNINKDDLSVSLRRYFKGNRDNHSNISH